jgi:hypothetical protein
MMRALWIGNKNMSNSTIFMEMPPPQPEKCARSLYGQQLTNVANFEKVTKTKWIFLTKWVIFLVNVTKLF